MRLMRMKRFAVACTLVAFGTGACSGGASHSGRQPGTSSEARPASSTTKLPAGTLVLVADPCVGAALNPATRYYPVAVSVRNGSQVVFHATVAGGRENRLPLPAGSYVASAPYDRSVQATLTAGATATVHLTTWCK